MSGLGVGVLAWVPAVHGLVGVLLVVLGMVAFAAVCWFLNEDAVNPVIMVGLLVFAAGMLLDLRSALQIEVLAAGLAAVARAVRMGAALAGVEIPAVTVPQSRTQPLAADDGEQVAA